eukprot:8239936-Alexandrium_andersonii.AAC.1
MHNDCTLGISTWKDRIERSYSQDQWIDIMRKMGYGEKAFSKSKAKGQVWSVLQIDERGRVKNLS